MSLIILTKDSEHIGGVYCGMHQNSIPIVFGNFFVGATIGCSDNDNTLRVKNFFQENGNLVGVHQDDWNYGNTNCRQYAFVTDSGFFIDVEGIYAPTTALTQSQNTLLMGNYLLSGTSVYSDIFNYIDNSTEGVKNKLVNGLKTFKQSGLDRRSVQNSCKCIKMVIIDKSGNLVENIVISDEVLDPIDLLT